MVMSVQEKLEEGHKVSLTLTFDNGETHTLDVPVRSDVSALE